MDLSIFFAGTGGSVPAGGDRPLFDQGQQEALEAVTPKVTSSS